MKILVACEFSGVVRDAFIARGHDATSCDLLPTEHPGPHIQGDVRDALFRGWDMMIAFPPCTHLASSGARWFAEKIRDGRQEAAVAFFYCLARARIPRVAIENPVGIMSTRYGKPDQIIQPWQFGHGESKATCLWLHGLPLLRPTHILTVPQSGRWSNQTPSGQNRLGPSPDRAKIRGRTYQGIADAMAKQWTRI
jgi:site-specific DNA-cytosine methylase